MDSSRTRGLRVWRLGTCEWPHHPWIYCFLAQTSVTVEIHCSFPLSLCKSHQRILIHAYNLLTLTDWVQECPCCTYTKVEAQIWQIKHRFGKNSQTELSLPQDRLKCERNQSNWKSTFFRDRRKRKKLVEFKLLASGSSHVYGNKGFNGISINGREMVHSREF